MRGILALPIAVGCISVATSVPAHASLSSQIVPSLEFPAGTMMACDGWLPYEANPENLCWKPGREHWVVRMPFGQTSDLVSSQMAELGLSPYSTYGDGPSTSWGKGTNFRVTVEMDQKNANVTDVYVIDINSVSGAT